MVPKTGKIGCRRGVSLLDTMAAVVILMIALLGTFTLRYTVALDGRRADARTTAARIAMMLCESWRGIDGDETYDPVIHLSSDLKVAEGTGPAYPDDFTLLGSYTIAFDDGIGVDNYMTTLSWKDIQSGLRALNVIVTWASREQLEGKIQQIDGISVDKSYELTIFTQTY
ncbi:hypothetical protein ACFL5Z_15560 [Planctomycetota bacterium]